MNHSPFRKRIFTLPTFAVSARLLFAQLDEIAAALAYRLPRAFSEKVMMAVTQVNGCRYCSYAHTRMALAAGVSETELHDLLGGTLDHIPPHERTALLFAQHYAEQTDRYDAAAWQILEETYGADTARALLVHIRLISFANLYGNTFDALLERLRFRPVKGSRFWDEVIVLSVGGTVVPAGVLLGLLARRIGHMLRRQARSVPHA